MCLDTVASKEELGNWKKGQGKYVKVYKACEGCSAWEASMLLFEYLSGWNTAVGIKIEGRCEYESGFHCFTAKEDAVAWAIGGEEVVSAYIPSEDVIAMGRQGFSMENKWHDCQVVVSRTIYMPKFPETVAEEPK